MRLQEQEKITRRSFSIGRTSNCAVVADDTDLPDAKPEKTDACTPASVVGDLMGAYHCRRFKAQ